MAGMKKKKIMQQHLLDTRGKLQKEKKQKTKFDYSPVWWSSSQEVWPAWLFLWRPWPAAGAERKRFHVHINVFADMKPHVSLSSDLSSETFKCLNLLNFPIGWMDGRYYWMGINQNADNTSNDLNCVTFTRQKTFYGDIQESASHYLLWQVRQHLSTDPIQSLHYFSLKRTEK